MDAFPEDDLDELLFEPFLPSPPDSQTWDSSNQFANEEILQDWIDDSQPSATIELEEPQDSGGTPCAVARDRYRCLFLQLRSCTNRCRNWVIDRIESMLEQVVDGLLTEDEQLTISLKTRIGLSRRQLNPTQNAGAAPPPRTIELNYPGSNVQEARRFTIVVRILELILCCLIDDIVMTKRDMYYRHPDLFGKQAIVDRYVDDVACTLGVSRSLLNVTAAAKGLTSGNFVINRPDGTSVHGLSEPEGILVPTVHDGQTLDVSCVHWVLIIEKEATFRSVLSSPQWKVLGTQGLVLTAKGYPDLVTRKFLRQLADGFPHIPMFAFVDLDPDGIHIMSTYKHGSLRLAHEVVTHADTPGVNLPNLQWLGVQSHHIYQAPGNECDTTTAAIADAQGVMKLTARDRKKAHHMLEWGVCGEHSSEPAWRAELQRMLMLNIKAEMQILDELPGGLVSWLSKQLEVMRDRSADDEILF
ncbi:DNA topoisomerase IV, alpha subunit [Bimuria novae-zelandiae CBS 107.79]|uniref:DNA topoisomerase (ATP-hydrolyzing) n=1 Tax=Bimuria novae-zelandiae CBS 107.79 TaxID=1447943 RepID=A0A6A5UYF9_9PLEO|nr:DNA topoisomerase IV, alpha subunit [Bimuria novae-zelandiae CBS 107.79]